MISLAKARTIRNGLKLLLLEGKNPNQVKRDSKLAELRQQSFKSIAEEYFETRGKDSTELQKSHNRLRTYVYPKIGSMPIDSITSPMIASLVRQADEKNKGDTAKRVLAVVRNIFTYARAGGLVSSNPAEGMQSILKPPQKKSRPHELDITKIGKLLKAIDELDVYPPAKAVNQLLPMLFCRKVELLGARWDEIDWDKKQLEVPVSRMKISENGAFIIPLPRQANRILTKLRPYTEVSGYIFASERRQSRTRAYTHISDGQVNAKLDMALKAAELPPKSQVPHGWRHVAETLLKEKGPELIKGFNKDWIRVQMHHSPTGIEASYDKAQYLKDRPRMMQAYADLLDGYKGVEKLLKVVK